MKRKNRQESKQLQQQPLSGKQIKSKRGFAAVIIGLVLVTWFMVAWFGGAKQRSIHEKAEALGIYNAPWQIEKRHVSISERKRGVGRYGDVPVHIMARANSNEVWKLCGTGTMLGKRPGYLLTAYHVFEGRRNQYGCREISPKEFTGKEQVIPIISCQSNGNADDGVICSVDQNSLDFPSIEMPVLTNMFNGWVPTKSYNAKVWPAKIHFNTYPEITINNLLFIEIGNGAFHYIFDWTVAPGESGTGAFIEGGREDAYLVVIRGQQIPKAVIDQFPEKDIIRANWSPSKVYGVGNLILVNPKP